MKRAFLFFMITIFQFAGISAIANEKNGNEMRSRQWSMFWSGGGRFGDYGMSVDDAGTARLTLLSKSDMVDVSGAGIIEARDGLYDQNAANRVRRALCDSNSQAGRGLEVVGSDPAAMFWASCEVSGRIEERAGHIALLPKKLFTETGEGMKVIRKNLLDSGVKKIWINASVVKIERRNKYFLVTIRMINSGREEISFKRPDLWSNRYAEEILEVVSENVDRNESGGWRFALAGKPLANKEEFDTEYVTLQGGAHRDFIFEALPDNRYKAGTYKFYLYVWMGIGWKEHGENSGGHVEFYTGGESTVITIDRDYPSTPQEREQWEATHRTDMSFHPVKPGENFSKSGLYRSESLISRATSAPQRLGA